jgi:hypothetical protein
VDNDEGIFGRASELLECHLRVRGERRIFVASSEIEIARRLGREPPPGEVRWFPDTDDLLLGIEAALAWVADPPTSAPLCMLVVGDRQRVSSVAEARTRIAAVAADRYARQPPLAVWWESATRFRLTSIALDTGNMSLVEGGEAFAAGSWPAPYEALLEQLRSAARWAAYGFIKRGRRPKDVLYSSLTYDWLPALHYGSYNLGNSVYEDVLAPDAFGAQLLGRGYGGRIPQGSDDWSREDLQDGATLVVHREPEAWYGRPLPPLTAEDCIARDPSYPTPPVVVEARETFADILATADVVRRGGLDPLA